MANEYLRAFVIGSCSFVFLPYFYAVSLFPQSMINYTYQTYTFIAPVALGLMNLFSLILAKRFGFNRNMRFLVISLLAPTIILLYVYLFHMYNYTTMYEWIYHIVVLYAFYFVMFNVVVYALDQFTTCA